jgi:serine protease SohB
MRKQKKRSNSLLIWSKTLEFLANYGLFLAKAVTVVAVVFVIIVLVTSIGGRKKSDKGQIEVTKINEKFDQLRDSLREAMMDEEQVKEFDKSEKKRLKAEKLAKKKAAKEKKKETGKSSEVIVADVNVSETNAETVLDSQPTVINAKKRTFVLDFDGDIKASQVDNLREEITSVLSVATPNDEVLVRLESGGGMVHAYGLASSQLARVTKKSIPLTVCVDKVAASGGYMMACVADKIIAAPFAIVGSIGVVAQVPNVHRLLKKHDVDYDIYTAGEYKRTVTVFGENTEKGKEKFVEDLHDTHVLFKEFVSSHRPEVDVAKVANGDVWYGSRAIDVKLIDEVSTSDEYLMEKMSEGDIYSVKFTHKKSLTEKIGFAAQASADRLLLTWWERLHNSRWF